MFCHNYAAYAMYPNNVSYIRKLQNHNKIISPLTELYGAAKLKDVGVFFCCCP